MSKTIKIHFSEEDLQDIQNGEIFNWSFKTEETEELINVKLFLGDEDSEEIEGINLKEYIETYILPTETKENIILYHNYTMEYDTEYIREHIKHNTLINKKN